MASIERIKASDGSGNAATAIVQNVRSAGNAAIVVNTVTDIPANFMASMGTPHTFTDPVTHETITVISEATCVDFAGHVNGSALAIDTIAPGYTDLGSAIGDIVIIRPTTQYANNLAAVLAVILNDDGTLKNNIVAAAKMVNAGVFTGDITGTFPAAAIGALKVLSAMIAANAVTADKLATDAILLGYNEKTTDFSTASTSVVQITGLSQTVTIPAGGRKAKITVFSSALTNTNLNTMTVQIWDGPVGSGTQVGQANCNTASGGDNTFILAQCIVSPGAGSKTYNAGMIVAAGTGVFTGRTYAPSYIMVELL